MAPVRPILASVRKEFHLLARDVHGLAILFVMPVAFVLIMSLALQDVMGNGRAIRFELVVLDEDGGPLAGQMVSELRRLPLFEVEHRLTAGPAGSASTPAVEHLRAQVLAGQVRFALHLPAGLGDRQRQALQSGDPQRVMNPDPSQRMALPFMADPALRADARELARAATERAVSSVEMQALYSGFTGQTLDPDRERGLFYVTAPPDGSMDDAVQGARQPSSTQQNVPAYALLAMFMMVVPLSATFIRERAQGTLDRLRSIPVAGSTIVIGKVLPFFLINLIQLALCLLIGVLVLPSLGAPALTLGRSPGGILLLGACASLAAIGFSLLVAMVARTTEQATAFGAAAVLVMAALGGVMVPRLMMPPGLQAVGDWSPLAWALDGFLALFVRGAMLRDVLAPSAMLLCFGMFCLVIAAWQYARMARRP